MLAFLRDANTSASVIQIINLLDKTLGTRTFSRLFPVILADNGSELGACEVNHEFIRRILPKGSSFYYGEDVLKKLGCRPVAAENIILKPKLLKK